MKKNNIEKLIMGFVLQNKMAKIISRRITLIANKTSISIKLLFNVIRWSIANLKGAISKNKYLPMILIPVRNRSEKVLPIKPDSNSSGFFITIKLSIKKMTVMMK